MWMQIGRYHPALCPRCARESRRLSAGCGAKIEDAVALVHVEQERNGLRRFILN
jgi:hypothetical protein